MDWVKHQLETRGVGQGELAAAIGLSESQMSKVFGGTRRLTAREADDIRRFFGYRLPDDPMDAAEARVFARSQCSCFSPKTSICLWKPILRKAIY